MKVWRALVAGLLLCVLASSVATADPLPEEIEWVVGAVPQFGGSGSPLRPGASLGGYCTFNFVFYGDGRPAPVYIGTAAHCTERVGERVALGSGPTIGTVVYDSDVAGSASDFTLVKIDADMVARTTPKMLGTGGPYGVATLKMLEMGDRLDLHGQGIGFSDVPELRTRFGYLTNWNTREYAADLPSVNGDSGAPLLHHESGFALGIISRYGATGLPPSTDMGPLLSWILRELRAAGFSIRLATV